jgi:hypothetical protein
MVDREQRLTEEVPEVAPHRQSRRGRPPGVKSRTIVADAFDGDGGYDERSEETGEGFEELSDDERFDIFVDALDQSVLPDLPKIPGYHVCWLTTTHQSDTIPRRLRLGYTLIQADDLGPEWGHSSIKTGSYAGCVGINEMIAAKIPLRQFNRYMQELHHHRPLSEEEKLRSAIDAQKARAEELGGRLDEGDAMAGIINRARAPDFVRQG